jgi:NTP pyrophosphatase (non-canonical NTP hydrolase)
MEPITEPTKTLLPDSFSENLFVESFRAMQRSTKNINVDKGFNQTDVEIDALEQYLFERKETRFYGLIRDIRLARTAQKLMLVVGELGEAIESLRKGDQPDSHIPDFKGSTAEYADAIIRLMNLATDTGAPVAEAIVAKNEYNSKRPSRHGGKAF